MKQSIDKCLAEYSNEELIQFHANLNALFLCCTEDFKLFPLLLQVHFAIAQRKTKLCRLYLEQLDKMMNIPEEYKYKKSAFHS